MTLQCERLLLILHVLRVEDPVRHPASARSAAARVWWHHLRMDRTRTRGGHLLEVHAHARTLQPDDRERHPTTLHRVLEHERCVARRHADHALQVRSPSTMCRSVVQIGRAHV